MWSPGNSLKSRDIKHSCYLLLAQADPLAAAHVVSKDRGLKRFLSLSDGGALKRALRCAASAARHPKAAQLADTWLSLSSHLLLTKAASVLSSPHPHTFHSLLQETTTGPPPRPRMPWRLPADRDNVTQVPYQHSDSLRRVLLDTIHGFYLQALAIMPTDDLQSLYHRSLLKAGHCYGPFDPVSNIILNTIWYEAAFPPPVDEDHKLDAVGTMSLLRIGVRSFYGLVSHLCTTHQNLTLHQALRCLLDTDLNIQLSHEAAAAMTVNQQQESIAREEAFRAAAIAAAHPKPEEQVEFLCSCEAMLARAGVPSLLDGRRQLCSGDVQHLAGLLCPKPPARMPLQQPPVSTPLLNDIMAKGNRQRRALRRISQKVKAALTIYGSQNQNSQHSRYYQLHVICGVNEFASGPQDRESAYSWLKMKKYNGFRVPHDVYRHTHANFLVTQYIGSIASRPILFFAELNNYDDDQDSQLLCCPVELPPPCAEPIRCLFCEHQGIRIVHPASEKFHGREVEFDKLFRGEDLYDDDFDPELEEQFYANYRILASSGLNSEWVGDLEEDCMYIRSDDLEEG